MKIKSANTIDQEYLQRMSYRMLLMDSNWFNSQLTYPSYYQDCFIILDNVQLYLDSTANVERHIHISHYKEPSLSIGIKPSWRLRYSDLIDEIKNENQK
jgi:hypothetical protein